MYGLYKENVKKNCKKMYFLQVIILFYLGLLWASVHCYIFLGLVMFVAQFLRECFIKISEAGEIFKQLIEKRYFSFRNHSQIY